jgi:hypothetical protein
MKVENFNHPFYNIFGCKLLQQNIGI